MTSVGAPATDPCQRLVATAADGARVELTPHGGQLLSWVPAGGGPDRLWTSPLARCGPGLALRGGVPVVFPQFAGRGPLPKHGLARDRAWRPEPVGGGTSSARLAVTLADDDATRAVWPHRFGLRLQVTASGDALDVELRVSNPGPDPWTFTAALHSYLATHDATAATVTGLGDRPAQDNAAAGAPTRLPAVTSAFGPCDVVVPGITGPVVLADPVLGRLRVTADGLPDRVLWNPGQAVPDDVPPGGATGFVCIEPAVLTPVPLGPGQSWRGTMRLVAEPLADDA